MYVRHSITLNLETGFVGFSVIDWQDCTRTIRSYTIMGRQSIGSMQPEMWRESDSTLRAQDAGVAGVNSNAMMTNLSSCPSTTEAWELSRCRWNILFDHEHNYFAMVSSTSNLLQKSLILVKVYYATFHSNTIQAIHR